MNKRHNEREKLHLQLNHLTDAQVKQVLSFIHSLDARQATRSAPEPAEDELTLALITARENRRARQVFEWESARRRAEARAATQRHATR